MLKGCTFDNQNITSQNDGGLYQAIFPQDGILWGCGMSVTNDAITIQPGEMMIGGRLIWVDGATQIPFTDPISDGYGQVILEIDLSQAASTSEFDQVSTSVVYSTTTTFPVLTQGDINDPGGNMVYQQQLAVVSIDGGNITGITNQIGNAGINAVLANNANMLGGQLPSYYAKANRGFGRLQLTGQVGSSVNLFSEIPFQGQYVDSVGTIALNENGFQVTEAGLYLIVFCVTCTSNNTVFGRIRCSDGQTAGSGRTITSSNSVLLASLSPNTTVMLEAYTTEAATYSTTGTFASIIKL